ncbi:MAG: permease-like cell division protein FtsX [Acutalibacteraceae bacterium]|nr:permease-like cell division protein FtsX [Acutalibacteraceae bacterium]
MRSLRYLLGEGFKNVWANRLMSFASIGVLMACMLMMGVAVLLTENVSMAVSSLKDRNVIMVYFGEDINEEQARGITDNIKNLDNVDKEHTRFVSKDEGLESLKDDVDEYALSTLEENPLPHGAEVIIEDLNKFESTKTAIQAVDGVDSVRSDNEVVETINGIEKTVSVISIGMFALLLIIAVVIICNTIRITMYARKLEISIMKAVGATNHFITFPFMVEGAVIGLIAAVLSDLILYVAYILAQSKIESFLSTGSLIPFREQALPLLALFSVIGVVVGLLGSRITLSKYLRKEGSEFRAI